MIQVSSAKLPSAMSRLLENVNLPEPLQNLSGTSRVWLSRETLHRASGIWGDSAMRSRVGCSRPHRVAMRPGLISRMRMEMRLEPIAPTRPQRSGNCPLVNTQSAIFELPCRKWGKRRKAREKWIVSEMANVSPAQCRCSSCLSLPDIIAQHPGSEPQSALAVSLTRTKRHQIAG